MFFYKNKFEMIYYKNAPEVIFTIKNASEMNYVIEMHWKWFLW